MTVCPPAIIAALALTILQVCVSAADSQRVIGIEGRAQVTLPRGDYQPKPLDDRTPLVLRMETPSAGKDGGFVYDFHYIGFEPGSYKLAEFLIHADGTPATELADHSVTVSSVLPAAHQGALNSYELGPLPRFGGYRILVGSLAALWVLGLAAFAWFGRRRKSAVVEEVLVPPPTYAERMLPLVEAAAAGTLTISGQAELERLMTGFWRDKLSLPELRMADALMALKDHPQAGALLRALERWLHRPGGAPEAEIRGLLEPYRHAPVVVAKEVSA